MRRRRPRRDPLPRRILIPALAAGVVVLVLALGLVAGLVVTASPGFYTGFSRLAPRYDSWASSNHKGVPCTSCHQGDQSGASYRLRLVADFYSRLLGRRDPAPAGFRFERPTRQACLGCHKDDWGYEPARVVKMPHRVHGRVGDERRDCVGCHKWTAHVEAYQEKHKKIPYNGICASYGCHSGRLAKTECANCHHAQSYATSAWRTRHPQIALARGENSCLDYCHESTQCRTCHQTGKKPDMKNLTVASSVRAIATLHSQAGWLGRHGRKAREDTSKCFYCHGSNAECKDCHSRRPAFHGSKATWLGQHQELGKNRQRCLACHAAKECDSCHAIFKEGR